MGELVGVACLPQRGDGVGHEGRRVWSVGVGRGEGANELPLGSEDGREVTDRVGIEHGHEGGEGLLVREAPGRPGGQRPGPALGVVSDADGRSALEHSHGVGEGAARVPGGEGHQGFEEAGVGLVLRFFALAEARHQLEGASRPSTVAAQSPNQPA